jgi:RNA polymerase sigma factor (sigma-70 family)
MRWFGSRRPKSDERDLVERMLAGHEAAFDEFMAAYLPRIYRFALSRTGDPDAAEDVAQETLAIACRKLHTWRGEAALFTWLATICRREIAQHAARTGREAAQSRTIIRTFAPRSRHSSLMRRRSPIARSKRPTCDGWFRRHSTTFRAAPAKVPRANSGSAPMSRGVRGAARCSRLAATWRGATNRSSFVSTARRQGGPVVAFTNAADAASSAQSAYVNLQWTGPSGMSIAPGVRLTHASIIDDTSVSPWIVVGWRGGPGLRARAAAAIQHQAPDVGQVFGSGGNRALAAARSRTFETSVGRQWDRWRWDVAKRSDSWKSSSPSCLRSAC